MLKKREAAMQRLKAFQTSVHNVEAPQSKQTLKTIQDEITHPSDIPGVNPPTSRLPRYSADGGGGQGSHSSLKTGPLLCNQSGILRK